MKVEKGSSNEQRTPLVIQNESLDQGPVLGGLLLPIPESVVDHGSGTPATNSGGAAEVYDPDQFWTLSDQEVAHECNIHTEHTVKAHREERKEISKGRALDFFTGFFLRLRNN